MAVIDLNKVINYSKVYCKNSSIQKCATYVKRAFEAGGCTYISGDGWNNQNFCKQNGFICIGDFVPVDKQPRAHNNIPMQFPEGYTQKPGDICLIKHGQYGHICYAYGYNLGEWVSDYWQGLPGGPYCYTNGGVERVQFWRNPNIVMNNTSVNTDTDIEEVKSTPTTEIIPETVSTSNSTSTTRLKTSNSANNVSSTTQKNTVSSFRSDENTSKYSILLGTHMKQKK